MDTNDFVTQLADFIQANSKDDAIALLSKSLIAIARTQTTSNLEYEDERGRVEITLKDLGKRELH